MAIRYTKREEQWNAWSHAAGIALGIVFGIILVALAVPRGAWADVGVALYLFGMLASYIASTVYHSLPSSPSSKEQSDKEHTEEKGDGGVKSSPVRWDKRGVLKERLRRWDHAAIYWHIAGSYSPITLVAMRSEGWWGYGLFVFVWLCAIGGTIVSFIRLKEHSYVETLCFVLMGLSVLVAFGPLLRTVSAAAVAWIIAEGVCYITGALFYCLNRRRYMHSVFHFFVLAGSICHIIAVWDVLTDL